MPLKGRKISDPKQWNKEPDWYTIGPLPAGYDEEQGGAIDWGRMKDKLMFWEVGRGGLCLATSFITFKTLVSIGSQYRRL